jgi:2-keto-4-pentenoate hydratase
MLLGPFKVENKIDELAQQQLKDFRSIKPGTCFSEQNFSLNINEAYSVQNAVVRLRVQDGERVVGYKVGCTGPGTTKMFGINGPIRGTLFDEEIHTNGVELDPSNFCNLAVEAEMAIKVGELGQIDSVFPVIELHNLVFRAPKKSLSELIANNGLNKGIVLSEKNWESLPDAYEKLSVLSLEINGSIIDFGDLWPMTGGPLSSLNWLQKHLIDHDLILSAGDIILGGTALGLYPVRPGDEIDVKVNGVSAVQCFINSQIV